MTQYSKFLSPHKISILMLIEAYCALVDVPLNEQYTILEFLTEECRVSLVIVSLFYILLLFYFSCSCCFIQLFFYCFSVQGINMLREPPLTTLRQEIIKLIPSSSSYCTFFDQKVWLSLMSPFFSFENWKIFTRNRSLFRQYFMFNLTIGFHKIDVLT